MNYEDPVDDSKPFIIWTLQRTGGTNLYGKLFEISRLQFAEHEPFNLEREYGHITKDWLELHDSDRLDSAVQAVMDTRVVIKHCVETVPWEISESLARASALQGYQHLFLYRRNATERLLSLHFAKLTGIWGPEPWTWDKSKFPADGAPEQNMESVINSALEHAIPVEGLVSHEQFCANLMTRLWALLQAMDAKPVALAFEDMYQSGDTESLLQVLGPFTGFGTGSNDDVLLRSWLDSLISSGAQGTRDEYSHFPGVSDLAEQLQYVTPPFLAPLVDGKPLRWRGLPEDHAWVFRFFVDVQPEIATSKQYFAIGGVLVVSDEAPEDLELKLVGETSCIPLRWGQRSPNMAKKYPQARNSKIARWSGTAAFSERERRLYFRLSTADGQEFTVGELRLAVGENSER